MLWKHAQSAKAKQCQSQPSAEKVTVTILFDYQDVLLLDFKEPDVNINSARYADGNRVWIPKRIVLALHVHTEY